MHGFRNLSIGAKFYLIMSILLITMFLVAAYLSYKREQTLILKVAVDNARSFAKQIIETRDYMSSVVRGEADENYALVPQVVATQVAKRITSGSKYYVRQVSLRYRNPGNRPDEFESGRLRSFAVAGKAAAESYSVIRLKGEEAFRYMLPMVAEKSCLECHGSYEKAPRFVRQRFPRGHYSYNYNQGDVIGAVSVTIPMVDLYREIGANLLLDIAYLGMIFLIIIVIMGALIRSIIINPVTRLSEAITHVARTGLFAERLPQTSNDEVGRLTIAFNDLMEELDRKTMQRMESEERYRKFIHMTHSAVVTFMEDGKIVISNEKAEQLFGLARQNLLGESIYLFLENGEALRQGIADYLREGKDGWIGTTTQHRIRDVQGQLIEVEMSLSDSITDHSPMFTAILRKIEAK